MPGGITPNSNHAALALLRADPESATEKFGFMIDPYSWNRGSMVVGRWGGPASVSCLERGGGIFVLTPKNESGGDYYYPHLTTGVTKVVVPFGCSDGAIALTPAMNGCALQVNRDEHGLTFMHDGDGTSMKATGDDAPPANSQMVCRVDYAGYGGAWAMSAGENMASAGNFRSKRKNVTVNPLSQSFCICVKKEGRWKVFYSTIITLKTDTRVQTIGGMITDDRFKTRNTVDTKFLKYRSTLGSLITSFEG